MPTSVLLRLLAAVAAGLAVGAFTSFGQSHLEGSFNPLVNSASAWLVLPFIVGTWLRSPSTGALAGVLCCAMQVVGYFVTSELRGFPVRDSIVVFWTVCALVGGPIFGAGGHLWRCGSGRLAAAAATLLPAVFLAEGIWVYGVDLRQLGSAALWSAIGVGLVLALARRREQLRWLPVTVAVGLAGEVVLSQVHSQAF